MAKTHPNIVVGIDCLEKELGNLKYRPFEGGVDPDLCAGGHVPGAAHGLRALNAYDDGAFRPADKACKTHTAQEIAGPKPITPCCCMGERSGHGRMWHYHR